MCDSSGATNSIVATTECQRVSSHKIGWQTAQATEYAVDWLKTAATSTRVMNELNIPGVGAKSFVLNNKHKCLFLLCEILFVTSSLCYYCVFVNLSAEQEMSGINLDCIYRRVFQFPSA